MLLFLTFFCVWISDVGPFVERLEVQYSNLRVGIALKRLTLSHLSLFD